MRRFPVFSLFAVLLAAACGSVDLPQEERCCLLVYFAANNNLDVEARKDYSDIVGGWVPQERSGKGLFVFRHFSGETPALVRIYRDSRGAVVEKVLRTYDDGLGSVSEDAVRRVLCDMDTFYPCGDMGLVLWSHGSGWLPRGYYANPWDRLSAGQAGPDRLDLLVKGPARQSFGVDGGSEMEIGALARALAGRKFGFIVLDCCLMGCVEVAWELREVCDYLVVSPTEILTEGFPYSSIIEPMLELDHFDAMGRVCRDYMAQYRSFYSDYASASVSLVRTSGLGALASEFSRIVRGRRFDFWNIDRDAVQPYFRGDRPWFYDMGHAVSLICGDDEAFASALSSTVVFHDETESFLSIPLEHCCGLSMYLPSEGSPLLNGYYETLAWDREVGLVSGNTGADSSVR